jgi:Arc/MetJ-type ribon-helix-helix transcriptional regulator
MQVTLPPELAKIVQEYLLAGQYQNPIDVLQAGLHHLQAEEALVDVATKIERLKQSGAQMDLLLQEHGLTEDDLVDEFRRLRKQGY